jgi:hypothetical protein
MIFAPYQKLRVTQAKDVQSREEQDGEDAQDVLQIHR